MDTYLLETLGSSASAEHNLGDRTHRLSNLALYIYSAICSLALLSFPLLQYMGALHATPFKGFMNGQL